jgi:hypothetical protein
MKESLLSILQIGIANAQEKTNADLALVRCGNTADLGDRCKIGDLFELASRIGEFALSVLLPMIFFVGVFIAVFPLLRDPNVPANRAQAKHNGIKLLIGTLIIVGAYAFVKILLGVIGANPNVLVSAQMFLTEPMIGKASAQTFSNPLNNVNVQNVMYGISNFLVYVAVIGIIMGIVRGVMLLLLGQENPENIKKGKIWIIYSLIIAAIVFGAEMIYNIIDSTARSITK